MRPTIARTATRKIADIREKAVWCKMYDQDTGQMVECDPDRAWDKLSSSPRARLIEEKPGSQYMVHVHSNLFYRLTVPADPPYKGGEQVKALYYDAGTVLGPGQVVKCEPDSWRWPNHWRVTVDLDANVGEKTYHAVNSKGESDYLSRA